MSDNAVLLLVWPALTLVTWYIDRRLLNAAHRRTVWWMRLAELQRVAMAEALKDNQAAFKIMDRALKRMVELGEPPDEFIDWMRDSLAMSKRQQERGQELGAHLNTEP